MNSNETLNEEINEEKTISNTTENSKGKETRTLSVAEYVSASLLNLNIMKWCKYSRRLEIALIYIVEHKECTEHLVKNLYAHLANTQHCEWTSIERSLRYAIKHLWTNNAEVCSALLYRSQHALPCPCVSEFLRLYVDAFERGSIQKWVDDNNNRLSL